MSDNPFSRFTDEELSDIAHGLDEASGEGWSSAMVEEALIAEIASRGLDIELGYIRPVER